MTTGSVNDQNQPDDAAGEKLREVLLQAAASVSPADGSLGQVLARAHERSRWSWAAPVLAAAAVVLLGVGAVSFAVGRGSGTGAAGGPSSTGHPSAPTASSPTTSATGSGQSQSPTGTATGQVRALPVYYAAVFNGQARLYREFHAVRSAQPGADAIRQLLGTPATDPDYESLWPRGTTLVSYSVTGSVADVALSVAPDRYPTTAFQQVVYSVTAADPGVTSVRISYGSITLPAASRAPATDIVAPVWLLAPGQGATVGSPVTLSGTASVFEANVSWEVDNGAGTKVAGGSAMASIGAPGRGPWSTTVALPPGQYVAMAFAISPKDGLFTWVDTKSFTVR